jgi:hypothetical protein
MEHPDWPSSLDVGCVCAEKMAEGYDGRREVAELRRRAARKARKHKHIKNINTFYD